MTALSVYFKDTLGVIACGETCLLMTSEREAVTGMLYRHLKGAFTGFDFGLVHNSIEVPHASFMVIYHLRVFKIISDFSVANTVFPQGFFFVVCADGSR